jgi:hypothetical protein
MSFFLVQRVWQFANGAAVQVPIATVETEEDAKRAIEEDLRWIDQNRIEDPSFARILIMVGIHGCGHNWLQLRDPTERIVVPDRPNLVLLR